MLRMLGILEAAKKFQIVHLPFAICWVGNFELACELVHKGNILGVPKKRPLYNTIASVVIKLPVLLQVFRLQKVISAINGQTFTGI